MSSATSAAAGARTCPVVPPTSLQLCALQRKPAASSSNLALATAAFTAATLVGHSQACSVGTARKTRAARRRQRDVQRADGVEGGVIDRLLGGGRKKLEEPEVVDQRMHERRQRELTELEQQLSERKPCELDLRLEALRQRHAQARARAQEKKVPQRVELKFVQAKVEQPQEQPLDGWRMVVMGDGTWFYANERSGARSWEAPVPGAPIVAREPNGDPKETRSFLRVLDLMSGLWYYHDEQAACSSWEAPHGMRMAECPPPPPSPWRRVLHISSREWCYLNEETRETRWELPPAAKECELVI